ncbi:UNVERIFIED_CONTAM: protein PHOX1 [Sesamum radiatum]|uniref:Protein PHOX1 n=1 Tax=Sesamum radiatum TaxID=300843 RepID=A0AAW2NDI3_SESRA
MGKQSGKNKKSHGEKSGESNFRQAKANENSARTYDKDTAVFILMSQELKDEGNRLFQKRDYEGAMLKYEKAIKLLPSNHIDVSYLRSNMAACHMQLGISEYPRAIHECNLALEVTPKYKRVKKTIERQGSRENEIPMDLVPLPEYLEPPPLPQPKVPKEKARKKKSNNVEEKRVDGKAEESKDEKGRDDKESKDEKGRDERRDEKKRDEKERKDEKKRDEKDRKGEKRRDEKESKDEKGSAEKEVKRKTGGKPDLHVVMRKTEDEVEEKKTEDKLVVEEEKLSNSTEEEPKRTVKLVFGEDIRWAKIPLNCNFMKLREIISDRFPPLRLFWLSIGIKKFAQFFKNYVGFDVDAYLDLHEIGMKLYSDAMEDTVTSEEAQDLFSSAAEKFQEMAA